jgi:hypothetical protein
LELDRREPLAITEHFHLFIQVLVVAVGQVAHQEVELYFHLLPAEYTVVMVDDMVVVEVVGIYILGTAELPQGVAPMERYVSYGAVDEHIPAPVRLIHLIL